MGFRPFVSASTPFGASPGKRILPDKNFVGTCNICKYMKSSRLEDIIRVLKEPKEEDHVVLDDQVIDDARRCIEKMFEYAEPQKTVSTCE